MDKALKERIIGAIVLVAVAVLLVPVFLDGPADDSVQIQESIYLPGQEEQSSKQKTVVLERDREQPAPMAREAPKAQVSTTESPAKQPPVEKPLATVAKPDADIATAKTAANDVSSTGMWAVQLGSFSSKENAERLAASLRKEGYAAFLSQSSSGATSLHRVRVGPQKDRASAEDIARKLGAAGHEGQVVPHP